MSSRTPRRPSRRPPTAAALERQLAGVEAATPPAIRQALAARPEILEPAAQAQAPAAGPGAPVEAGHEPPLQQWILMPARGGRPLSAQGAQAALFRLLDGAVGRPARFSQASPQAVVRVLHSMHQTGPKLVEASATALQALRVLQPGVRILPLRGYQIASAEPELATVLAVPAGAGGARVRVTVIGKDGGGPLPGARVQAVTDLVHRAGAEAITDEAGRAELPLIPGTVAERLYVMPVRGHFALRRAELRLPAELALALDPLHPGYPDDALLALCGPSAPTAGAGVTVAVIDTGVGPHPDLPGVVGRNTVVGEDPGDFGDNGVHHGTHVAGIIGARGRRPAGLSGVAPGARLRSYRAFARGQRQASNYAIAVAIDQAAADRCDVINLSLVGGPFDEAISEAIQKACDRGCLVVAAAGNQGRRPVSFPASDSLAVAVTAYGRRGTYPGSSLHLDDEAEPAGTIDPAEFLGAFSNCGHQVAFTAPGVAIISTVPGGYAALSGTSMAAPALSGLAARLLAAHYSEVMQMRRGRSRSDAMRAALVTRARRRGFGPDFEGSGSPA